MNLADLLKKNIVMVPVVASVLVGTFTGVKYIVNLKDTIPDWKVQTSEWNVEDDKLWRTQDTDKFFYEMEEKKND